MQPDLLACLLHNVQQNDSRTENYISNQVDVMADNKQLVSPTKDMKENINGSNMVNIDPKAPIPCTLFIFDEFIYFHS